MTAPVAGVVRDDGLRDNALRQIGAVEAVSPFSMATVASYIGHLEALVDTANISISEAQAELRAAREMYAKESAGRDEPRTVDFQLDQRTAETLDAERYRYLRSAAGQWTGDECGPMVCSGCGDNFEYLRGEEVDQEVDEAMAEWKAAGSPAPTTLSSYKDAKP